MSHNRWRYLILVVPVIALLILSASASKRIAAAPLAQTEPGSTYWSYAVKYVCGFQRPQPFDGGEPPVKPGNYATEINIHNFTYNTIGVRKKVLAMVDYGSPIQPPSVNTLIPGREPRQVGPRRLDTINLRGDWATMDDCNRLWQLLYPPTAAAPVPPSPLPLTIGYLILISRVELDVDAVYTAEVSQGGEPFGSPTGISIDVQRVEGKKVFIPDSKFPGAPLIP